MPDQSSKTQWHCDCLQKSQYMELENHEHLIFFLHEFAKAPKKGIAFVCCCTLCSMLGVYDNCR